MFIGISLDCLSLVSFGQGSYFCKGSRESLDPNVIISDTLLLTFCLDFLLVLRITLKFFFMLSRTVSLPISNTILTAFSYNLFCLACKGNWSIYFYFSVVYGSERSSSSLTCHFLKKLVVRDQYFAGNLNWNCHFYCNRCLCQNLKKATVVYDKNVKATDDICEKYFVLKLTLDYKLVADVQQFSISIVVGDQHQAHKRHLRQILLRNCRLWSKI